MGLWDSIKSVGKSVASGIGGLFSKGTATTAGGIFGGVPGALIGGAVDLGFDWLNNEFLSKPNADNAFQNNLYASAQAFDRSYDAYKRRYQDTMADMKAAGLNPILAAGSGGFNVSGQPTMAKAESPMATLPNTSSAQSFGAMQQAQLAMEQSKTEEVKRVKLGQEARESLQRTANERQKRGLIQAQEKEAIARTAQSWANIQKIEKELKKIGAETQQSRQLARKFGEEIKILKANYDILKKQSQWYYGAYGDFIGWLKTTLGAFGSILGGSGITGILK